MKMKMKLHKIAQGVQFRSYHLVVSGVTQMTYIYDDLITQNFEGTQIF